MTNLWIGLANVGAGFFWLNGEPVSYTNWLCKHIPDRYEHLMRYVGWYSNRAR